MPMWSMVRSSALSPCAFARHAGAESPAGATTAVPGRTLRLAERDTGGRAGFPFGIGGGATPRAATAHARRRMSRDV